MHLKNVSYGFISIAHFLLKTFNYQTLIIHYIIKKFRNIQNKRKNMMQATIIRIEIMNEELLIKNFTKDRKIDFNAVPLH